MSKAKCDTCGNISEDYKYTKKTNTVLCNSCIMEGIPKGYAWLDGWVKNYAKDGITNFSAQYDGSPAKDFEIILSSNSRTTAHNHDPILTKWTLNYRKHTFIEILQSMDAFNDDYNDYLIIYNSRLINADNAPLFKVPIKEFLERVQMTFAEFEYLATSKEKYKRTRDR